MIRGFVTGVTVTVDAPWRLVERYIARRFAWVDDLTPEVIDSWFNDVPGFDGPTA